MIQKYFKSFVLCYLIVMYLLHSFLAQFFFFSQKSRRTFFLRNVQRYGKIACAVLGIETTVENLEKFRTDQNYLIVCNHLSYIDPMYLSVLRPMCFITSEEMRHTPVLGQILQLSGCVFVERRNKQNIKNEISEITQALQDGFNVVVFPEATSTDGAKVYPFKRSLLAAAVESKTPVLPIAVQYEELDGQKVTIQNRDRLCWYGSMDFTPHFFQMAGLNQIKVRLKILDEIPIEANTTRDILVDQCFRAINTNYKPIC